MAGMVLTLGLAAVLGCSPAAAREPVPNVVAQVEAVQARVAVLAERTSEAVALGAACKAMCVTEPARIRSLPNGRLECDCRALPSLGVHRVSRRNP